MGGGINDAKIIIHRFIVSAGDSLIGETFPPTQRKELLGDEIGTGRGSSLAVIEPQIQKALAGACALHVEGTSALLAQANQNYGHWHIDVLPSVALLQELQIAGKVKLLTSTLHSYRRRSLELLGVDFRQVQEISNLKGYVSCERLLFPSPLSVHYGNVALSQRHIYDRILAAVMRENALPKTQRIYIDRSGDPKRRCLNESALAERLQKEGFVILRPAELTYDQQVLLFAQADVVVGPMGAGFVNTAFCKQGAVVIELKPPAHDKTTLWKTYATRAGALHHSINFPLDAKREGDSWAIPDVDRLIAEIRSLS